MRRFRSVLVRALIFAVLWWVLMEGDLSYAVYALFAVPAAVALSLLLAPPRGGSWTGLPRRVVAAVTLTVWVVYRAVIGGADVALRAVHPSRGGRADPQVVTVPIRLTGTARAFALGTFNLMPGTLVQGTIQAATDRQHPNTDDDGESDARNDNGHEAYDGSGQHDHGDGNDGSGRHTGHDVHGGKTRRADGEDPRRTGAPGGYERAVVHILAPDFQAAENWADLEDRVAAVAGQDLR